MYTVRSVFLTCHLTGQFSRIRRLTSRSVHDSDAFLSNRVVSLFGNLSDADVARSARRIL